MSASQMTLPCKLYVSSKYVSTGPKEECSRLHCIPLSCQVISLQATQTSVYALGADGVVRCITPLADVDPSFSPHDYRHDLRVVELRWPQPGRCECIAAGTRHALFGVKHASSSSMLTVYALGNNIDGQCGQPAGRSIASEPVLVPAVSRLPVRKLFAGSCFSAATLSTGGIAIWGGLRGRLGTAPSMVVIPPSAFCHRESRRMDLEASVLSSRITDVAVGDCHFTVLTSEGFVYTLPAPPVEQLNADTCTPYAQELLLDSIACINGGAMWGVPIVQIAASDSTSYAIASNGYMYSWGRVHKEWLCNDRVWAGSQSLIDPQLSASTIFAEAADPIVVETGQRWRRLSLAKTGTREGDDISDSTSTNNILNRVSQAELGHSWRDRSIAHVASTSVPWVLAHGLGITHDFRIVPADGWLKIVHMSDAELPEPPKYAHELLLEYWSTQAVQTSACVAFVGLRDSAASSSVVEIAFSSDGKFKLTSECESAFALIPLPEDGEAEDGVVLWQQSTSLPPTWASVPITSMVNGVVAHAIEELMLERSRESRSHWEVEWPVACREPDERMELVEDVFVLQKPLQYNTTCAHKLAPIVRDGCHTSELGRALLQAALFYDANSHLASSATSQDTTNSADSSTRIDEERKEPLNPAAVTEELIPTDNPALASLFAPSTVPRKTRKQITRVGAPLKALKRDLDVGSAGGSSEEYLVENDEGSGYVFSRRNELPVAPISVDEPSALQMIIGLPGVHLTATLCPPGADELGSLALPVPLNWWELYDSLTALCEFVHGRSWRADLIAESEKVFLQEYELLLSRISSKVSQDKRAKCKLKAAQMSYHWSLSAAVKRRHEFAACLGGLMPDFKLVDSAGRSHSAHKTVLQHRLPHLFDAIINSNMIESRTATLPVAEELQQDSIADFLTYIYTGEAPICPSNAQSLLETADVYMIDDLKRAAEHYLLSSCVNEANVEGLLELAIARGAPRLANFCSVFGLYHGIPSIVAVKDASIPDSGTHTGPRGSYTQKVVLSLPASRPVDNKSSWASIAKSNK